MSISGVHGKTVHCGARKIRQGMRSVDVFRQNASQGEGNRDYF